MNKIRKNSITIYYGEGLDFAYMPPDYVFGQGDVVTLTISGNDKKFSAYSYNILANTVYFNVDPCELCEFKPDVYQFQLSVDNHLHHLVLVPPKKFIVKEVIDRG